MTEAPSTRPYELRRDYFLSAGETDAQGCMPMALIFSRAIEIATEHANILGIGYQALKEHGIGWVLTRMTVKMDRYPGINDTYTMVTWIEGLNRLYSDRCFCILDSEGNEIGHLRSMWVAIDFKKRTAADLSVLDLSQFPVSDKKCPLPPQRKMAPMPADAMTFDYTFHFSDLDFNRHVNTVQYVRHFLNLWSLDFFDHNQISMFEIAFHQECYYGEMVQLHRQELPDGSTHCEISRQGKRAIAAIVHFTPRTTSVNNIFS